MNTNYIERLFNKNNGNFYIFYGHQEQGLKRKNYFFFKQGAIKFIFNIEIFLNNKICDIFPPNAKNIYIHHDVYDSILISKEKEVELFKRIIKYDYLFLSNKKTILFFNNYLNINKKLLKNKKLPKIFEAGYFKLDYLRNIINDKRKIANNIVIAISDFKHVPKLSIVKHAIKMINYLMNNTNYNIFFRPYPGNEKSKEIIKLAYEFSNNKRFSLDLSENYFKVYSNTKFLVTDISGTAYTYAFFTKKPVIFFSPAEKLVKKYRFDLLSYFIDRKKIGLIAKNYKDLSKAIKKIDSNSNFVVNSNKNLLAEMTYIDKSKKRINFLLNNLINNKL